MIREFNFVVKEYGSVEIDLPQEDWLHMSKEDIEDLVIHVEEQGNAYYNKREIVEIEEA